MKMLIKDVSRIGKDNRERPSSSNSGPVRRTSSTSTHETFISRTVFNDHVPAKTILNQIWKPLPEKPPQRSIPSPPKGLVKKILILYYLKPETQYLYSVEKCIYHTNFWAFSVKM